MSENTENTAVAGDNNDHGNEFRAPASQADLDRIVGDRLARERAKFADYDDLKAKATQFDVVQSRISELEALNVDLSTKVQGFELAEQRAVLVSEIAKDTGVPAGALRGETRDELQAHADALKEIYKPNAPVIAGQESAPGQPSVSPEVQAVRKLFNS